MKLNDYQNRSSMQQKENESLGLRFLYRTVPGRMFLKALVCPAVSKAAGHLLDSKCSGMLIKPFQKRNKITLEQIEVPAGGFSSFNSFFSRKRRPEFLTMPESGLVSPCDGYLSCYKINAKSSFYIKHVRYSLTALLKSKKLAQHYQGGTAMIFRLTPAHYHRYHFIDDGVILNQVAIPGILHTVRPIAIEQLPVFSENARELTLIETKHFGKIVQMEVGALLVGKIVNHPVSEKVSRGMEKGYFAYGGSTIILLFEKDQVCISEEYFESTKNGEEISVKLGDIINEMAPHLR